jgi:hypothetical protein
MYEKKKPLKHQKKVKMHTQEIKIFEPTALLQKLMEQK